MSLAIDPDFPPRLDPGCFPGEALGPTLGRRGISGIAARFTALSVSPMSGTSRLRRAPPQPAETNRHGAVGDLAVTRAEIPDIPRTGARDLRDLGRDRGPGHGAVGFANAGNKPAEASPAPPAPASKSALRKPQSPIPEPWTPNSPSTPTLTLTPNPNPWPAGQEVVGVGNAPVSLPPPPPSPPKPALHLNPPEQTHAICLLFSPPPPPPPKKNHTQLIFS